MSNLSKEEKQSIISYLIKKRYPMADFVRALPHAFGENGKWTEQAKDELERYENELRKKSNGSLLLLYNRTKKTEKREKLKNVPLPKEMEIPPLDISERETMLKLILVMAVGGYGYNPKQSREPIVRLVSEDCDKLGLPIDNDTISKWIKDAREEYPNIKMGDEKKHSVKS